MSSRVATISLSDYWSLLAGEGCLFDSGPAEIAHCHGGSIVERLQEPKAKGWKLPRMDWLVLPLCTLHHRIPPTAAVRRAGAVIWEALDDDVEAFELRYGTQASWIDFLAAKHSVPLWHLAKKDAK